MKSVVSSLVENVKIPRMFQVRQIFPEDRIEADQIPEILGEKMNEEKFASQIKPGMTVAITVGSRQIANILTITKTIVDFVKEKG